MKQILFYHRILILFLFVIGSHVSFSQIYDITYSATPNTSGCSTLYQSAIAVSSVTYYNGANVVSSGGSVNPTRAVFNIAWSFRIAPDFGHFSGNTNVTVMLNGYDATTGCASDTQVASNFHTSCPAGSITLNVRVRKTPATSSITPEFGDQYCWGENISLQGIDVGATAYNWQAIYNGTTYDIESTADSTTSITLDENFASSIGISGNYLNSEPEVQFQVLPEITCLNTTQTAAPEDPITIRIYTIPPKIESITITKPDCPDGGATLEITHAANTPIGTEFIYSWQPYTPLAICATSYLTEDYVNDNITEIGTTNFTLPGDNYCPGADAYNNFYTFDGSNYVIEIDTIGLGSDKELIKPGVYELTIETRSAEQAAEGSFSGCVKRYFFTVDESDYVDLSFVEATKQDTISCSGGNDGSLEITISDGFPNYTWTLSPTNADLDFDNDGDSDAESLNETVNSTTFTTPNKISALANYRLSVVDGCNKELLVNSVNHDLEDGPEISPTIDSTPITCTTTSVSDGTISVTSSLDFDRNYTYQLKKDGSNYETPVTSADHTASFTGLFEGTYEVEVSIDGCHQPADKTDPKVIDGVVSLSINLDALNKTSCSNANDGSIEYTVSKSGSAEINVDWELYSTDDATTILKSGSSTGSINIGGLASDTYNLKITDICNESAIEWKNNLSIEAPVPTVIKSIADIQLDCYESSESVNVVWNEGTADYNSGPFDLELRRYTSGSSYTVLDSESDVTGTSHTFSGITRTDNDLRVMIEDNCGVQVLSNVFNVDYPDELVISQLDLVEKQRKGGNYSIYHTTCDDTNDGEASFVVSGGTIGTAGQNYYQLSKLQGPSFTSEFNHASGEVTYSFSDLTGESLYNFAIEDFSDDPNGCRKTISFTLDSPEPIQEDEINFTNVGVYSNKNYIVCNTDADFDVTYIGGETLYDFKLFYAPISGGTPSQDYSSVSGTFITDRIGTRQAEFQNVAEGRYYYEIEDQIGCKFDNNKEVIELNNSSEPLSVSFESIREYTHGYNISCTNSQDGEIEISFKGGIGQKTVWINQFDKSSPKGTVLLNFGRIQKSAGATTHTFNSIPASESTAGILDHTVVIEDEIGCVKTIPGMRYIELSIPPEPEIFVTYPNDTTDEGYHIRCRGDDAPVTISTNGDTFDHTITVDGETYILNDANTSQTVYLTAGTYSITMSDVESCDTTQSITLKEPLDFVAIDSLSATPPVCLGDSSGLIYVDASKGTPLPGSEYMFKIRKLGGEYEADSIQGTSATFVRPAGPSGLDDQIYEVLVKDKYGCSTTQQITMEPTSTPLSISVLEATPPSCHDGDDGSIRVGISNYTSVDDMVTFYITGGHYEDDTISMVDDVSDNEATFTNLLDNFPDAGETITPYSIWVVDDNNCEKIIAGYPLYIESVILDDPEPLGIDFVSTQPSCYSGSDGEIDLTATGGVGGYSFIYESVTTPTVDGSFNISNLIEGEYTVSLIDDNYQADQPTCTYTTTIEVDRGRWINFDETITDVSCFESGDGELLVNVSVDSLPPLETMDNSRLTLDWEELTGGFSTQHTNTSTTEITNLDGGRYELSASYQVGSEICQRSIEYVVDEPSSPLSMDIYKVNPAECNNPSNGGSILFDVAGGYNTKSIYYRIDSDPWELLSNNYIAQISIDDHTLEIGQTGNPTDGFECIASESFTIVQDKLDLTVDQITHVSCNGEATGGVTFNNIANVTYTLVGGVSNSTGNFSSLAAGTYEFIATSNSEFTCQSNTIEVTITEPDALTLIATVDQDADCDQANGQASAVASGGTGDYSYSWKDESGIIVDPLALLPGNYDVTVEDENGCSTTESVTIGNNPGITLDYTLTNTADCDYPNGAINLEILNGTAPFTINGTGGYSSASIDFTTLVAGDTTFEVSDARGCGATLDVNIPWQNTLILASEMTMATCGESNGSLTVLATGGTAPYTFSWVGYSDTDNTLENIESGSYRVEVTDSHGCTRDGVFPVDPASGTSAITYTTTDSYCEQATGSITLTSVTGDYPPYEVSVNTPEGSTYIGSYNPSGSDLIIPDLAAGTYGLEIEDANGCLFAEGGIELQDDASFIPLVAASMTDSSACGLAVGIAEVVVTSGESPFTYTWFDAEGNDLGINNNEATDLQEGTYTATVLDNLGCQSSDEVEIVDRDNPTISLIATTSSPEGASIGTVTLEANQGTGAPYTYYLSNTDVNLDNSTGEFTGLASGIYEAYAQDATACITTTISFEVSSDPGLEATLVTSSSATCEGATDGSAEISVSGGVAPYSIEWDGIIGSETNSALGFGDHTVLVTDDIGSTFSLDISITALDAIDVTEFSEKASCPGECDGTIDLLITGGSGSYDIEWDNGSTGANLTNLCPGTYTYTVSDVNNGICNTSGSILIEQQEELAISQVSNAAPTCNDGTDGNTIIEITGGSVEYSILWENGDNNETLTNVIPGTYTVEVTDDVLGCSISGSFTIPQTDPIAETSATVTQPSCFGGADGKISITLENTTSPQVTWNTGQVGTSISNLSAGTYTYSVIDSKGCTFSGSVDVGDRDPLEVAVDSSNPLCFGSCTGEISITPSGGTAPYFIQWDHGPRTTSLTGLCAGTYSYIVNDVFNCSVEGSVTITQPEDLVISLVDSSEPLCFGDQNGTIEVEVTGGVASYLYSWSNGGNNNIASGLAAGEYSLEVEDSNGCKEEFEHSISQPSVLRTSNDEITIPSCNNTEDGELIVNPAGGTLPYSYEWSNGATTQQNTGLTEGQYVATITDANNCTYTKMFTLSAPNGLDMVEDLTDPTCYNGESGSIDINIYGGTLPYSYDWSNGETTEDISNIGHGSYQLTVYDANNCEISGEYELINPVQPIITGVDDYMVLCTGGVGTLEPDTEWSSYSWSGPNGFTASTKRIEVSVEGDYTLVTTNEDNCESAPTNSFVEFGDNLMEADFLRISEAFVNEPIVFVDISLPIPENVEWIVPDDPSILINSQNNGSLELVFTETGTYEIGMEVSSNTCFSEAYKTVTVAEGSSLDEATNGRAEPEVEVSAYPNPASDQVTFQLNAPTRDPIDLILLSNIDNRRIYQERLTGSFDYLVKWDVSQLKAGIYFLYIKQGNQSSSKRIVVK